MACLMDLPSQGFPSYQDRTAGPASSECSPAPPLSSSAPLKHATSEEEAAVSSRLLTQLPLRTPFIHSFVQKVCMGLNRHLYPHIHSRVLQNSQKVKETHVPSDT